MPAEPDPTVWIAVDGGTTRTRAWLLRGTQILAEAQAACGARDVARARSREPLDAALRRLFAELQTAPPAARPQFVAAVGMITSALGLAEVPHVPAPASLEDLAAGARRRRFPALAEAPFWLFPGVRCGDAESSDVTRADLMRGEETLCAGLLAQGRASAPFALLHLGSHWKWIEVDAAGRIASCCTTLSGELLQAARTDTVLATALPATPPAALDLRWCQRGMALARGAGLSRALFCVRLLQLQGQADAAERLAFALGALVAADEPALLRSGDWSPEAAVFVEGWSGAVQAWVAALAAAGRRVIALDKPERDAAFLTGLRVLSRRARA